MVLRHFWLDLVERAWRERSVVWLAGVRRVGKTYLCQSLPDIEYFDCELPRVRRMMEGPGEFPARSTGAQDCARRSPQPAQSIRDAQDRGRPLSPHARHRDRLVYP